MTASYIVAELCRRSKEYAMKTCVCKTSKKTVSQNFAACDAISLPVKTKSP